MSNAGSNQHARYSQKHSSDNKQDTSILQKISNVITGSLERAFYRLGRVVGGSPWTTILLAILLCAACMAGFVNFTSESRGEKLWIPQDSKGLDDKEWVDNTFPAQSGRADIILKDANVLTTKNIRKMLKMHQEIVNITIHFNGEIITWQEMCFKKGENCSITSLLELWLFSPDKIENLTDQDILQEVNSRRNISFSPYSKSVFKMQRVVGDMSYSNGRISGAKYLKATYFYEALKEFDAGSDGGVDARAEIWEKAFGEIMEKYDSIVYQTITKGREISDDAISGDIILLSCGYLLIFVYVFIMLGKFSRLEIKVWIALAGILSVGLSVGVSIGLCSAMGLFYGPAHTSLPFLLLGIGVDDLFVIVQSWSNIPAHVHKSNSVPERIGLALKHAGTSITITTITDLLAFLVGATTIIPGLKSFCFYAAIGILCDYALQITFFVALLALDAKRSDARRDGCCCCCILPQNYTPNNCGDKNYLQTFFEKIFGKGIVKWPTKIFVIFVTLCLLGVNIYGTTKLKQQFERKWFLPKGTVAREYIDINDEEFSEGGSPVSVFTGAIDYYKEQKQLHQLNKDLQNENKYLSKNSIDNWFEIYIDWANKTMPQDVDKISLTVQEKNRFYELLHKFLNSSTGNRFVQDIKWKDDVVVASRIRAFLKTLTETKDQVDAMDTLRDLVESAGLSSDPIVYNQVILFAEGHKVIAEELWRNVFLAMAVVFIVTFVIIASPVTSFLVFLCVVFTVIDVTGVMYFWGLTIDTVSTVVLIIAVGLSVDYASHVGHTFLVKSGTRKERTIKTFRDIGPAVWNGGFSTLLAIVPLSTSESHVFNTFFKILFGVVVFGVFHGLAFLPTMLSMVGPSPYQSAANMESSSKEANTGSGDAQSKVIAPVNSYTNKAIENGKELVPDNNAFVINNAGEKEEPAIVEVRL